MEKVKPHIRKLPIVSFPKYHPTDTNISVSIPLFYSTKDSRVIEDFDESRFRKIHIRGAIYAAKGIINNTDLGEKGVPIYFHIDKAIKDIILDEFAKYEVPLEMIRVVDIPETDNTNIQYPQFGKKLMCFEDTEFANDVWLIVDSDAFTCTTGESLKWYDTLANLNAPAPLRVWEYDYGKDYVNDYKTWVRGVLIACGMDFKNNDDTLYKQELECIQKMGFDFIPPEPDKAGSRVSNRVCISTHIFATPSKHPVVDYILKNYHNCYQDEFMLGLWHMQHNDMISLMETMKIQHYKLESDFVNRDKSTDEKGYLAHITPDYDTKEMTRLPDWWQEFYIGLTRNETNAEEPRAQKIRKKRKTQLRLIHLGVPYGVSDKHLLSSPFVQKVVDHSKGMTNLGHHTIHLGHERSDLVCSEHHTVTNDDVLERSYGSSDYNTIPKDISVNNLAFRYYRVQAERVLRKIVEPDDLILSFFGWGDKPLCDLVADLPSHVVEASIGYPDCFARFRTFLSSSKMHLHRGISHAVSEMRRLYPDSDVAKQYRTGDSGMSYNESDYKSTVIPNFFDPNDFEYSEDKDDYMLFIGRVDNCKGLDVALKLAAYTGDRLIVAGDGDINAAGVPVPKHVEYVGVVDVEKRKELYRDARVCILPSRFLEPFCRTHAEAGFPGTPIIVPNHGAFMDYVIQGVNGYKCHPDDFSDYVTAYENIDKIRHSDCREYAMNFSIDRVSLMYHEWYHKILRTLDGDRWDVSDERTDLDWLCFPYPYEQVEIKTKAIQEKIASESNTETEQGVCIQIGIHTDAEYLYLAEGNWQNNKPANRLKHLPDAFDAIDYWVYYGIDADVCSISDAMKKHQAHNVRWINAFIDSENGNMRECQTTMPNTRRNFFTTHTTTLDTLLSNLDVKTIDVLAVDIEGSEIDVFRSFRWNIKPKYISVEVHGDRAVPDCASPQKLDSNTEQMINLIAGKGYRLINKTDTNKNNTGICTRELQFCLDVG